MIIRRIEQADEAAVIQLWNTVFPITAAHHDPATSIRKKREFDQDLFFVAVENECVIGTVMGGYDGHRGWVYSLAVDPAHRRRGVATRLMHTLETRLDELGCPKINLQVLAQNDQVVGFYHSLGYVSEARISMGKRLL